MTVDVNFCFLPRPLGKFHATESDPPCGFQRLRRHPDHVGAVTETLEWPWPHFDPRLRIVRCISLNEACLQAAQNYFRGLINALARLAECDSTGIKLPLRATAGES